VSRFQRMQMAALGLALAGVLMAGGVFAQDDEPLDVYKIGQGDVLRLNVPQQPELDGELTVQADGSVYVPQLGKVMVAGLTLGEAEELLGQRLRLYNPGISQVVLGVVEYNALRIFALGAVATPGSYTFEAPPTLWEVLRAAGGPAENASLASCRVISVQDGRPVSRTVNLTGYLTGEDFPRILLQGGDTLVVPTVADGTVGVPPARGVPAFGGVGQPTTVPIEGPTEMLSVLMLAGAPIETAEIHKIDWVHRGGELNRQGPNVPTRVNMRQFLEKGLPSGNPVVHPGDVIYLPQYRESWLQRSLPLFLALVSTATTVLLAYDTLSD